MNRTASGEDARGRSQRRSRDADATADGAPQEEENGSYHQPGVLRVLRTRGKTRAFYDKIAGVYDLLAERSEESVRRAGLEMLGARTGERILEVGFGTGHSLVDLARAVGPSGKVFGIDLSEEMLRISRERAQKEGVGRWVELTCGDALQLPYSSAALDGIFMSFTLELFDTPEIPRVLAECRRVLKDGGRLVVVGMSRVQRDGLMTTIFEWTHRHFPNYLDCRPILVRRALADAGFRIADCEVARMWINVEIVCGVRLPPKSPSAPASAPPA